MPEPKGPNLSVRVPGPSAKCGKDHVVTGLQGILVSISYVVLAEQEDTKTRFSVAQSVNKPEIECTPSTVKFSALGLH
jgi:hypothetical protein